MHDAEVRDAQPYILVVEDEFLIRLMLCECLREAGYHVIEARDADEALLMLNLSLPDLVISDVQMPGSLDGMGLLSLVKTSHPNVPVIVASGHFPETTALAAGADHFVSKPYSYDLMLKITHSILTRT